MLKIFKLSKISKMDTMNTKERAKGLYEKYAIFWHDTTATCKLQCLIAVDEILDVLGDEGVYSFADPKVTEYWQQVKQEIINL